MTLRAITAVAALTLAHPAFARNAAASSTRKPVSWEKFNVFALTVSNGSSQDKVTYRGEASFTTGDLRIDVDQVVSGKKEAGTMIVVGGRTLAVRSLELPAGYEIDALDAPVLSLRIVTSALMVALPDGPDAVRGPAEIDHRETQKPLRVASPSASGHIPAPWSLRGQIDRARDGAVNYDLELSAGDPTKPEERMLLRYMGSLSVSATAPALDDQFSLTGWKIYSLGPRKQKQGTSTILDYGAAPRSNAPLTIGALRDAHKVEDDPGEPDPTRDFSGFWKERCDQNFGLRIQRSGPAQPYSIVFCGPGGCGSPDDARESHITGDRRFQIVSADEIRRQSGDEWSTWKRCGKAEDAGKRAGPNQH